MNPIWTLTDSHGTQRSLADWGLRDLVRERVNQKTDLVTFCAEATASDADPLFAHGSTVILSRGATRWFYGRVIAVPGCATAGGEKQIYRVAGPWWYLENMVFQQSWQTTDGVDVTLVPTNKSRLVLGQKTDGTKLATGPAILEVLTYAISRGAPITLGTISPNAIAPYTESLDESCAEVIRKFLRWTPDAVAAFDYATMPFPTLSIRQRAEASVVTLPAYSAPVSGLELTPRTDLQVPAVVLKFEQTNDIAHDTFTSLTVQASPGTATGDELGALVMTLDLAGARATYHEQKVTTAAIPASSSSAGVIDWWKGKFPWLNDFADSDLSVVDGSHTLAVENPSSHPGISASDVPNELLSGSIAAWMNQQVAPLLVTATFQYTGADTDESAEVWGPLKKRVLYTRVVGTDAQTQTYSRLTSATEAEPIPTGLADALYAAAGVLQYDGFVEATEAECSGLADPGDVLNLTGGRAEWATMAAQVQRMEEQVDAGQTRVVVGPAHQLGHADLAALLRVNRDRRLSFRVSERTTGSASGNAAKVQGAEQLPRSDSVFRPSAGATVAPAKPFQLIDASTTSGLQVIMNANSFLQQSLTPNDTFAITGLGSAIAVSAGTQIWLELDFTSYAVTAASIQSGSGGWSGFPAPFTYTGTAPDQVLTNAYLLIGYIVAATSGLDGVVISGGPASSPVTAKIVQCVTQDLLLQNVAFNGLPAVFPFPHHAPSI